MNQLQGILSKYFPFSGSTPIIVMENIAKNFFVKMISRILLGCTVLYNCNISRKSKKQYLLLDEGDGAVGRLMGLAFNALISTSLLYLTCLVVAGAAAELVSIFTC